MIARSGCYVLLARYGCYYFYSNPSSQRGQIQPRHMQWVSSPANPKISKIIEGVKVKILCCLVAEIPKTRAAGYLTPLSKVSSRHNKLRMNYVKKTY